MDFREEAFLNGFSDGLEKVAGPRAAAKKAGGAVAEFLKRQAGKVTRPISQIREEMRFAGPAEGKPGTGAAAGAKRYLGRFFGKGPRGKEYRRAAGGAALRVGAPAAAGVGLGAALKKRKKKED